MFTRDIYGAAARALAPRPAGPPAFDIAVFSTLTPATPGPLATDEFWNTFHAQSFVINYELGESTVTLPGRGTPFALRDSLFSSTVDGDRVLRMNDAFFMTAGFPRGRRDQHIEVWRITRRDFAAREAGLHVEDGRASVATPVGGPWWIYTRTPVRPWAFAAVSPAAAGRTTPALADGASVDRVALYRVDGERFE